MITYTRGQIVTLPAILEEGVIEEQAIVLELPENGVMLVYCFEMSEAPIDERIIEVPVNLEGELISGIIGPPNGVH